MKIPTDAIEAQYHEQSRRHASEKSLNAHTAVALLMVVMVLMLSLPLTHAGGIKVGGNVDVRGEAGNDRQVFSPTIAVDPTNPGILVVGAMDFRLTGRVPWAGYYRSTNGGRTWSSSLIPGFPGDTSPQGLVSPLRGFDAAGVPRLAFDRSGNLYYTGVVLNLTRFGGPDHTTFAVYMAKFANDGANYVGSVIVVQAAHTPDFPTIAVDRTGGANDGNVYLAFTDDDFQQTYFTRSTDGGHSFSKPIGILGGGFDGAVAVDSDGNVYVASIFCKGGGSCFVSSASALVLVAKSADGGLTFSNPVAAASVTTIPPTSFPGNSFGLPSAPFPTIATDANGIYIVTEDYSTGDSDAIFIRSTDGGLDWSSPIRVNDVTQGQQFFPTITSSGGIISVAWYDSRLGQLSNGTITGLDVFYAESRDGGASFSSNVRVTTVSFDPNLVFFPVFQVKWIGFYISIAASPNAVHPIWADNRNACDTIDPTFGCIDQDIYTARITP